MWFSRGLPPLLPSNTQWVIFVSKLQLSNFGGFLGLIWANFWGSFFYHHYSPFASCNWLTTKSNWNLLHQNRSIQHKPNPEPVNKNMKVKLHQTNRSSALIPSPNASQRSYKLIWIAPNAYYIVPISYH